MSTNEPMTQERLDAIQERLDGATSGPWAAWEDQDGQPHMQGRLMVGVAAGVIPDGDTWIEGPDVNNPVAETYIPEDRTFIAHAREDVPALLAEVERRGALTTVDDAMVERAARGIAAHWRDWCTNGSLGRQRMLARAALNAALGTGEGA